MRFLQRCLCSVEKNLKTLWRQSAMRPQTHHSKAVTKIMIIVTAMFDVKENISSK